MKKYFLQLLFVGAVVLFPDLASAADITHTCYNTCNPTYSNYTGTVTLVLACNSSSPASYTGSLTVNGVSTPVHTQNCPAARGNFDEVNAATCTVGGWAYDPDASATSIDVHIYRDGPAGTGTYVASCPANLARPDVNTAFGITGNHGFNCALPSNFWTLGTRSLYIHAIDVNGGPNSVIGSSPRSITCTQPPVPSVSFTANPGTINPGDSATLTWTVSDATSCTASGAAAWSGAVSTSGTNSQSVTPTVTTTYLLSCTGLGGTTNRSVTVYVPTGSLTASPCTIPSGATSCTTTVAWGSADFIGSVVVAQGGVSFSTAGSNVGMVRSVTPDTNTFTLEDSGGTFVLTRTATVACDSTSMWAGGACQPAPGVVLSTPQELIRSGASAAVTVEVDSAADLTCTLSGGLTGTFAHTGSATPQTYSYTTAALLAAQIIKVECESVLYPTVRSEAELRIRVVPTLEEV